jgi:FAD/FMN-containing dehydrogenase
MTIRGAATSNFGLISPDDGGILLDMRKLRGDSKILANDAISVLAGTPHGEIERTLWTVERECPVLTTTYSNATIGGWLAGGHVGLGSGCHGAIWDDLVFTVRILTVEEQPRLVKLHGNDIHPVLHTFGAGGIIYDVVLRTEPRHNWDEVVAFFPTYEKSAAFVTDLSLDNKYRHRSAAAQDERLTAGQKSISTLGERGSCALLIIDHDQYDDIARLAERHGGHLVFWQRWGLAPSARQSIASMVYGHRMLWVKQFLPTAAFAHIYFDIQDPLSGQRLLKDRFGDNVLMETKFIRSKWMAKALGFGESTPAVAASVVTIVDGNSQSVHALLSACDELGLKYQSSHSNVVEDNGLFSDVTSIVEHKSKVDPYNLVNRGRLRSAREDA